MERLYKTTEVANILGVKMITLYEFLKSKKLKAHKLGGNGKSKRHWRIRQSDLDAFIAGEGNAEDTHTASLLKKDSK